SFLFSAFYEEILYRLYIPEQIKSFVCKIKSNFTVFVISEIPVLFLFALAHKYNGIFAVFNAGFAYIILRFFYKKTDNIFVNVASHFFYNLTMLFLSLI
ncbi:MAG: CPBP family intramembrane metalloprotease, partial [Spirochaetia bacterium]|nr:CPBP family intramembrane metalloprotease [Spirochaetia bacterium]